MRPLHPVNATHYFLPKTADEADVSAWLPILPSPGRVLRSNLFGDAFVVDAAGAVHMLERAACKAERVATSEEEFWREVEDDAHGWQLRALVDDCRRAGKVLADHQRYAFTTLSAFGGDYTVENIWVAPHRDWFAFTADVFQQIKNLPDGTQVRLKIID
jgi:hypothetical protein